MAAYKYSIFYYNIDSFRFMTQLFRKYREGSVFLGDLHGFACVVF